MRAIKRHVSSTILYIMQVSLSAEQAAAGMAVKHIMAHSSSQMLSSSTRTSCTCCPATWKPAVPKLATTVATWEGFIDGELAVALR